MTKNKGEKEMKNMEVKNLLKGKNGTRPGKLGMNLQFFADGNDDNNDDSNDEGQEDGTDDSEGNEGTDEGAEDNNNDDVAEDEQMFTQAQVNEIVKRAKAKAKKAAQRQQGQQSSNNQNNGQNNTDALVAAERENRIRLAKAELKAQLAIDGAKADRVDDLILLGMNDIDIDEYDEDDLASVSKVLKAKYSMFYDNGKKDTKGSRGTGSHVGTKSDSTPPKTGKMKPGQFGAALAKSKAERNKTGFDYFAKK